VLAIVCVFLGHPGLHQHCGRRDGHFDMLGLSLHSLSCVLWLQAVDAWNDMITENARFMHKKFPVCQEYLYTILDDLMGDYQLIFDKKKKKLIQLIN
tara:strand:+ start:2698 stop:2988 length:291 start_codon:yes stop_codon:yes gene_type:complete